MVWMGFTYILLTNTFLVGSYWDFKNGLNWIKHWSAQHFLYFELFFSWSAIYFRVIEVWDC